MTSKKHSALSFLKDIGRALQELFFPRLCAVCGQRLLQQEEAICIKCMLDLPYTQIKGSQDNPIEKLFWSKIPIQRATSYLIYYKKAKSSLPVILLKYHHRPDIGRFFGRVMARELADTGFFDTIDALLPVPLARDRQRKRGYNQSEEIARGIAEITGTPIRTDIVLRIKSNETQTHLDRLDRADNVLRIFEAPHPEALAGKHILLIDDLITTGSTLTACARALPSDTGIQWSVLTLYVASSTLKYPPSHLREE